MRFQIEAPIPPPRPPLSGEHAAMQGSLAGQKAKKIKIKIKIFKVWRMQCKAKTPLGKSNIMDRF